MTPEDSRYPFSIVLTGNIPENLEEGDAVIVQMSGESVGANQQLGTLLEVLGNPDSVDVQMRLVIEKFNLPHEFSKETIKEIEAISEEISPSANRLDLRDIDHVTIDGETAKDFDDAIAVKKAGQGSAFTSPLPMSATMFHQDQPLTKMPISAGRQSIFLDE